MTFVAVILTDTTDDTRASEMSTRWNHKRQHTDRTTLLKLFSPPSTQQNKQLKSHKEKMIYFATLLTSH